MMTRTFYRQYSVFKVQTSYEASLCQRAFGDLIIIYPPQQIDVTQIQMRQDLI